MPTIENKQSTDALRANSAIGAMFVGTFGGAWIGAWSYLSMPGNLLALAAVAACTAALLACAIGRFRRYRSALEGERDSPEKKRTDRLFHIINTGQWVLMIIGGNVLANIGLSAWIVPCIMLIVGLHFLPLAYIFSRRPQYVLGVLLSAFALSYPFLLPAGPTDPRGCLGAGLILWSYAVFALTVTPAARRT
jgi:hypothetical protein